MFSVYCSYRLNTVRQALSFFVNDHTTPLKCLHDALMSADGLAPFLVVDVVFLKANLCIFWDGISGVFHSEIYLVHMTELEGCNNRWRAENNCPLLLLVAWRKLEPKADIR